MTRKEVVKRALHFENPPYIPLMYYGTAPERVAKADALLIGVQEMYYDGNTTEWGFKWDGDDSGDHKFGIVKEPAIPDWDDLDSYKPMDAWRPDRFDKVRPFMEANRDKYLIADFVLSGFTITSFIRGFEDYMADMIIERENAEKLADIVFAAEEELIKACAKEGFDGICLADDWGTQNSLLISREMIREIFMPRYKKQIDLAHSLGLDVIMHSCGYIFDIIEDFIEIGLDAINPGQPILMGIERLGEAYKGRICFAPPIGYQETAIKGTVQDIYDEVESYTKNFANEKGGMLGFVASFNGIYSLGAPKENAQAVELAFEKFCGCRNS